MRSSVYINPGEFFFGECNHCIHTVLGSCIAITLWHPILLIGGMCHFILPGRKTPGSVIHTDAKLTGRYSDEAMALFEREATRCGTILTQYQAKVFGGSNMRAGVTLEKNDLIGTKNIQAALMHLSEREIPLLATHVGETGSRRIAFDVGKGDVWVRHVPLRQIIP